jgi:nucleoside-diphosphate kinase
MDQKQLEQTLVLIKPDALKNSVTGFILSQLSEYHTGSRFAATKIVNVSRLMAKEHYIEHEGKPFYDALQDYITGALHYPDDPGKRRVIAIVYQGADVLTKIRQMAGPTNPHDARDQRPGCLRALGTVVPILDAEGNKIDIRMDNLIHASANHDDAEREIKLWFIPHDLPPLMRAYDTEICQTHYYLKEGKLCNTYEPESVFLLAPGDVVWKSDLDILEAHARGDSCSDSLNKVAAKYLINRIAQD